MLILWEFTEKSDIWGVHEKPIYWGEFPEKEGLENSQNSQD